MGTSEQGRIEEEIGEYGDQVTSQLLGIIPYPERKAVRDDIEGHLRELIRDHLADGKSLDRALKAAFAEFGTATQVAQEYLRTRDLPYTLSRRQERLRSGTTRAYLVFILPAVVFTLLYQLLLLYGDRLQILPWLMAAASLAPVLAGFFAGLSIRDRFLTSVLRALLIVLAFAVVAAASAWTLVPSMVLPAIVLFVWFPAGLLSACGGAYLRQRRRMVQDVPQS